VVFLSQLTLESIHIMEQALLQKLKEISLDVVWQIVGDTKDIFSITDSLHSAALRKQIVEVVQLIDLKEMDDAPCHISRRSFANPHHSVQVG
jgi:hypothetical protein